MSNPHGQAARARGRTILTRLALYLVATWGTLAVLAHGLVPGGAWVVAAVAVYVNVPLVVFLRWRGWPFYPRAWFRLLVVRPFWYVQLLLPIVAAAGVLGLLVGAPFGEALLVGRAVAGLVLAVVLSLLLAGYAGSKWLVVRHVEVAVPRLARELDGFRIAQLSDLHVGPHTSRRFLDRVVRTTQSLQPDAIALTGDLVDDRAEDVAAFSRALAGLSAPEGVFLIPGNHDIYAGWDDVERSLAANGAGTVLVNDARVIRRGDGAIVLVGTGDPAGAHADAAAPDIPLALRRATALAESHDGPATIVALAHNPALWPALAAGGAALTLSGHTHWGQFAMPRRNWSLASPFLDHAMGAHREGDAVLYISPGTGYWGVPFRLGALPEVTLVTLRVAAATDIAAARPRAARVRRTRRRVA